MFETLKIKLYATIYVILLLLLMACIHYCNTGESDNVYEQLAEDIIAAQTGLEIDLSPDH